MTSSDSNRARVGKALDLLKRGLARFVEAEFSRAYQEHAPARAKSALEGSKQSQAERLPDGAIADWDVALLLRLMDESWNDVFRRKLGRAERSFVVELRGVRNRWAHQEAFSDKDTYRAVDSAQRLLMAMSAPEAAELEELLRFTEEPAGAPEKPPSIVAEGREPYGAEAAPTSALLSENQLDQLRVRAMELDPVVARGGRIKRFILFTWLGALVGIVLLGRSLATQHTSLWLVILGCLLAAPLAFLLVVAVAWLVFNRTLGSAMAANQELKELGSRLDLHKAELNRRVEEELPVLPLLPSVASEIEDPFMRIMVAASGADAMAGRLYREMIREKFYPAFLKQALNWWQHDRVNVDTYVRAHWDEILASAKEIEGEFSSDANFTVDVEGCRRFATWALRHASEDVRYYLPEISISPDQVTPESPEVLSLARILRAWGGHKYEVWLPQARAVRAQRATSQSGPPR